MADNLTFEQLFGAYKSNYCNELMTQEQNENLRVWHERRGNNGITLSQSDQWMMQAGLIKKKVLTINETGKTFAKLKKFSLNAQQFQEYLEMLAEEKGFDCDEVVAKLLLAGLPMIGEVVTEFVEEKLEEKSEKDEEEEESS